MGIETGILEDILLPSLAPNEVLTDSWVRQFINKLKTRSDNQIEATRMLVRTLEEDYQTADSFISAEFTEEIGVLTTAQSAQASRILTLESQVQTPTTGLLARVTTAEATLVTTTAATASVTSEVVAARQGSASLTARVTVMQNATSALDGRVSAYYGIKVASGTNIASLELMSTSPTSPSAVVLTASRFIIQADAINFGSATVYENTEYTFYTVASGRRYRWSGPFGVSDDCLMWFGSNGVSLGAETRTNGYWSFGTDGKIYYGSTELTNSAIPQLYVSGGVYETTVFGGAQNVVLTSEVVYGGGVPGYTFTWTRVGGDVILSGNPGNSATFATLVYKTIGFYQETWIVQITDVDGTTVSTNVVLQILVEP